MAWHDVREAARRLELSPDTVYRLCAARRLAHRRVGPGGGKIRVSDEAIEAYLASCIVPAAAAETRPDGDAKPRRARLECRPGRPDGKPLRHIK